MKFPIPLKRGDTIAIVAPAKAIEKEFIAFAVEFWTSQGFEVLVGEHCLDRKAYFAGTDAQRASDMQKAIDDKNIQAIICARGGYGCVRTLDYMQWAGMVNFPKWLIGFSDVTVFHQQMASLDLASVHATMPLNYRENSPESLSSLVDVLCGRPMDYAWESKSGNKSGIAQGELIGGNLTVLANLIGTDLSPDYTGRILFLEDVGEHLYAIDRMFYQLKRAGVLDRISGLIVGSFSALKDTNPSFGQDLQQLVLHHFKYSAIPVCFGFPAGHQDDNRALLLGSKVELIVESKQAFLKTL